MDKLTKLRSLISDALSAGDSERSLSDAGIPSKQAKKVLGSPAFKALRDAKRRCSEHKTLEDE